MHGMHVSGIIGANGSKKGVAPEVQLLAMKVFSNQPGTKTYYTDDVIMALEVFVTLGADVINLSLGNDADFYNPDNPFEIALQTAINQGVIVVAATGNAISAHYPSYYASVIDERYWVGV
jgi:lactocepin